MLVFAHSDFKSECYAGHTVFGGWRVIIVLFFCFLCCTAKSIALPGQ